VGHWERSSDASTKLHQCSEDNGDRILGGLDNLYWHPISADLLGLLQSLRLRIHANGVRLLSVDDRLQIVDCFVGPM